MLRIVLFLLLLFCFLFVPFYGVQWITLFYLLFNLLCLAYSRLLKKYIVVRRESEVVRGFQTQTLLLRLIVENRGFLPANNIFIKDQIYSLKSGTKPDFFIAVKAGRTTAVEHEVSGFNRGLFKTGPITIKCSDPFGCFPWEKTVDLRGTVILYPNIHTFGVPLTNGLPSGEIRIENKILEDVTRFRSLREYYPGDDVRRISWAASARAGQLLCKEYLPALTSPLLLLLNLNTDEYPNRYRSHRIERAIEAAASLAVYFIRAKQETALVTSTGVSVPFGKGSSHAMTILEILAQISPNKETQSAAGFSRYLPAGIPLGTKIALITPNLDEAALSMLAVLKSRNFTVDVYFTQNEDQKEMQKTKIALAMRKIGSQTINEYGNAII